MAETTASAVKPFVYEPKYQVRVERNVRLPTRDGTTLCADLVRPDGEGRFPAIIEYIPYRKDDCALYVHDGHHYFAERGFVGVRLDIRGTGNAAGTSTDEYMPVEQEDGYDAVEWCALQPWSNGKVGMYGGSYGGFTALQVAMHQPPHLKAIAPFYATDDRYTDDCHYSQGGNMRMYYDVGMYGGMMVAMNALPPAQEAVGEHWAAWWQARLEGNTPYLLKWMKHQVDGPYWRGASLRPGYDRIRCPVFLIGGWHDGYANAMPRIFRNLKVPKKLLMGPWVHTRPHLSVPGPRIDYLNEVVRFFAHWLRDEDTGIMREPAVAAFMQESPPPERTLDIIPGHWRGDGEFPAAATRELTYFLGEGGTLVEKPVDKPSRPFEEFEYLPTVGTFSGYWSGGGIPFYLPDDQRGDEAFSLVFTTPPLVQALPLLGWPRVILHAASSARVATFVAKLADVAPDGRSALIVDGSLNATRRQSYTDPEPLTPGTVYELDIPMNPTGWVVPAGHRIRLAIASADFPNLWPTPERAANRVYRGGAHPSRLVLPVAPPSSLPAPVFLPPPKMREPAKSYAEPPTLQAIADQITGTVTVTSHSGSTLVLPENRGSLISKRDFRCTASPRDPAQASIVGIHTFTLEREDGTFEVVGESTIRATATTFHIVVNLTVTRNGKLFFQKNWLASEPRRLL